MCTVDRTGRQVLTHVLPEPDFTVREAGLGLSCVASKHRHLALCRVKEVHRPLGKLLLVLVQPLQEVRVGEGDGEGMRRLMRGAAAAKQKQGSDLADRNGVGQLCLHVNADWRLFNQMVALKGYQGESKGSMSDGWGEQQRQARTPLARLHLELACLSCAAPRQSSLRWWGWSGW